MIMTKEEIRKTAEEMIAAPSCCPELKEAGQAYLDAMGTAGEEAAAKALIAELKEDVCTIDDVMGFFASEAGAQVFGKEKAMAMYDEAVKYKAGGGTTCFCPACQAGKALLDAFGA